MVGWSGRGGEGKQTIETKPVPKAGHSLGLPQGPLHQGCSPRTTPRSPSGLRPHERSPSRAGLSTDIQSVACVVGKEEVNTG